MSDLCEVCGPNKHEAPTVMCAACAFRQDYVSQTIAIELGQSRPLSASQRREFGLPLPTDDIK